MMMIPRKNSFDVLDNLFDDMLFENSRKGRLYSEIMKTDLKEDENEYTLEIDIPGYKKEDIKIELDNGYVTVTAKTEKATDESDKKANYIHKERYFGECSRSYYVGDNITEEDIKASFKNGTLCITVPKKEVKKLEDKKYIDISEE